MTATPVVPRHPAFHYRAAHRLLDSVRERIIRERTVHPADQATLMLAQVHATLAAAPWETYEQAKQGQQQQEAAR